MLGCSVKVESPGIAGCPLCGKDTLSISDDPVGRTWFACRGCGFSGDSLELFKAAKKLPTMWEAAVALMQAGAMCDEPLSRSQLEAYVTSVLGVRLQVSEFWSEARLALYPERAHSVGRSVLHRYGLWPGYVRDWDTTYSPFLGAAGRDRIRQLPTASILTSGGNHGGDRRTGRRGAVVLPYYDVPGRIRGMLLLTTEGEEFKEINIRPGGDTRYCDDGLFMLSPMPPAGDTVVALSSAVAAIHLQARHFMFGSDALPVVAYRNTTHAWKMLKNKSVVLWAWQHGPQVFKNAGRIKTAKIAMLPAPGCPETPHNVHAIFRCGQTDAELMAQILGSARPWAEVLRDTLLGDIPAAGGLLSACELDAESRDLLMSTCSEEQRDQMRELLEASGTGQPFEYEGSTLVETASGFMIKTSKFEESYSMLSNFKVIPEELVVGGSGVQVRGYLVVGQKRIPFEVDQARIDSEVYSWASGLAAANNADVLAIHSQWRRRFMPLMLFRYPVAQRSRLEHSGWDPGTKSFRFPWFSAVEGELHVNRRVVGDLPGRHIQPDVPMDTQVLGRLCSVTENNVFFWTLAAALMRNVLAPAVGWTPAPIGVVERDGAHLLEVWLDKSIGLDSAVSKIRGSTGRSGLPDTYPRTVSAPTRLKFTESQLSANVIMSVTPLFASMVAFHRAWSTVDSGKTKLDMRPMSHGVRLLPHFLAWIQSRNFTLDDRVAPLLSTARAVADWARATLDLGDQPTAITEALSRLTARWAAPPYTALLAGLKNAAVHRVGWVEVADDVVVIDLRRMRNFLSAIGCPPPRLDAILCGLEPESATLTTGNDQLTVKREVWDACGG